MSNSIKNLASDYDLSSYKTTLKLDSENGTWTETAEANADDPAN